MLFSQVYELPSQSACRADVYVPDEILQLRRIQAAFRTVPGNSSIEGAEGIHPQGAVKYSTLFKHNEAAK